MQYNRAAPHHVTVPDGDNLEDASGHAISVEAGEEVCGAQAHTVRTSQALNSVENGCASVPV